MNQTMELRNDYGNPDVGTCWESLAGGNHLRMWHQSGPQAHTNALFLAYVKQRVFLIFDADFWLVCVDSVSAEEVGRVLISPLVTLSDCSKLQNVFEGHTIAPNGYNVGR